MEAEGGSAAGAGKKRKAGDGEGEGGDVGGGEGEEDEADDVAALADGGKASGSAEGVGGAGNWDGKLAALAEDDEARLAMLGGRWPADRQLRRSGPRRAAVLVGGLPPTAGTDDVEAALGQFGAVARVEVRMTWTFGGLYEGNGRTSLC